MKPGKRLTYRQCKIGRHVIVADLSGIDSGKQGVIIAWSHPKAREISAQYPFCGGQGMKWVAIWLSDDNAVTSFPANRLFAIQEEALK